MILSANIMFFVFKKKWIYYAEGTFNVSLQMCKDECMKKIVEDARHLKQWRKGKQKTFAIGKVS